MGQPKEGNCEKSLNVNLGRMWLTIRGKVQLFDWPQDVSRGFLFALMILPLHVMTLKGFVTYNSNFTDQLT